MIKITDAFRTLLSICLLVQINNVFYNLSFKYTLSFKGGTFITDAVVQWLSLLYSSFKNVWTQVLCNANGWYSNDKRLKGLISLEPIKLNFYLNGPFLWMGFNCLNATEPLREDRLLFTCKSPGTIDLLRMKSWIELGGTQWFWTRDPWIGNPIPLPLGLLKKQR